MGGTNCPSHPPPGQWGPACDAPSVTYLPGGLGVQDLSKQLLPVSAESVGASAQQSHIPAHQLGELGMENRGKRERLTAAGAGGRVCGLRLQSWFHQMFSAPLAPHPTWGRGIATPVGAWLGPHSSQVHCHLPQAKRGNQRSSPKAPITDSHSKLLERGQSKHLVEWDKQVGRGGAKQVKPVPDQEASDRWGRPSPA